MKTENFDVVIVGGGHNGLTAAAYLAREGKSVAVLEREQHFGGAAISAEAFKGVGARLSRYSYLVSLFPRRIIDDLGLDIKLARRRYSSYTPNPGNPETGLLVDGGDPHASKASFERVGDGAESDFEAMAGLYSDTEKLARALFPGMCEPLPTRAEAREAVGDDAVWHQFIEDPLGKVITERLSHDLVRGLVATDGLIGTFTSLEDTSLDANRCFLYHVIGNETGDWDIPLGGMGSVTRELERVARESGATLLSGAEVSGISDGGKVTFRRRGEEQVFTGRRVLANVSPWVLQGLLGDSPATAADRPEGAQIKVNLLLSRLPRLRDTTVAPEAAFGGTFHINEGYQQLEDAYLAGEQGTIPSPLPCEIYCHSLTDPSILSDELVAAGAQTLTVFGLHTPDRLVNEENNNSMREALKDAVLASLNSVLAEPIENLLLKDADGNPCIEAKTTLDLEHALNMTGGNIFHARLQWPFLEADEPRDTPARRWGVSTEHPKVFLCGAGARRGGGVSGLGGHNAAMAVLEDLEKEH